MGNKKDPMEEIILEDLLYEADSIDREIAEEEIEIPAGMKEEIRRKLHQQIDEYERERVYAQLSEEDRKALELGREMLHDRGNDKQERIVYRKKSRKMYVAVIAVAVLVLAMGVTSIGGAEKVAEMMRMAIGDREIVKVDTSEDNYIVESDREEEAYQELKDVFGIEPVKIVHWPGNVNFLEAEIDEELQTGFLKYEFEGSVISYFISSHHTDSSFGMDIEDKLTDEYVLNADQCSFVIKEYETPESKTKVYSASYEYNDLEYYLIGAMNNDDFQYVIKNLIFFEK